MRMKKLIFMFLAILLCGIVQAQTSEIILNNGKVVKGKIKSLSFSVGFSLGIHNLTAKLFTFSCSTVSLYLQILSISLSLIVCKDNKKSRNFLFSPALFINLFY